MTDSSASHVPHKPGVYVKGSSVQVATTASRATALVFEGYTARVDDEPVPAAADLDYRDLQKQAMELDIPANQSADALRKQIDDALAKDPERSENPDAPETGGESSLLDD